MRPYSFMGGGYCAPALIPSMHQHDLFISKPPFSILVAARRDTAIQPEEAVESTAFCLSFQRTNSLAEKVPEAIWSATEVGPEVTGSMSVPEFCWDLGGFVFFFFLSLETGVMPCSCVVCYSVSAGSFRPASLLQRTFVPLGMSCSPQSPPALLFAVFSLICVFHVNGINLCLLFSVALLTSVPCCSLY